MKRAFVLLLVLLSLVTTYTDQSAHAFGFSYDGTNWTTLEVPGSPSDNTYLYGIDGSNIVGWYPVDNGILSFLYDGTDWTTFQYPGASATYAYGIDGSNIVGFYGIGARLGPDGSYRGPSSGFLYDGTDWTTLEVPEANYTRAAGIDGSNIVGWYYALNGEAQGSFLYDGTNWNTFRHPEACETFAWDIDGNNIVGTYILGSTPLGFLYDGTDWTTLQYPGASATYAYGIDGSNIVGRFRLDGVSYAFLYDGIDWTTFRYPGACVTNAYGIDESNIVGIYVTPEPTTVLLLGFGLFSLAVFRKKFKKKRFSFGL